MKKKPFRFFSRAELVEIIYQLQQENQKLTQQNKILSEKLADKELKISQAGSIAQATVGLTDIFGKAQETADAYLAQIQRRVALVNAACEAKLAQAQKTADEITRNARRSAVFQDPDDFESPLP